jgi:hypothetical protein
MTEYLVIQTSSKREMVPIEQTAMSNPITDDRVFTMTPLAQSNASI